MIDPFGRRISYLRVSVTDRCDLRCVYCMAEDMTFLPKAEILSLEELDRLCGAFIGLGVERIRLVSSWSMGACQTYAWAALHPEMVQAIAPISGSARTANFNKVFLAGNIRAITSDPDWNDGFYGDKPPIRGVKTMAALYAVGYRVDASPM